MHRPLGRRALLGGLPLAALACRKREAPLVQPEVPPLLPHAHVLEGGADTPQSALRLWTFEAKDALSPMIAVTVPTWGRPDERYPLVIALHGMGESTKTPEEGAMGWPRDYGLLRASERLRRPPLTKADYQGFVTDEELAATNAELARKPFGGVIVVCPFLPTSRHGGDTNARAFAAFASERLLPFVRGETPALSTREATGIDGVSLGGAFALRVGLNAPDVFGAVSGTQPAISAGDASEWVELAKSARAVSPRMKLRVVTSTLDGTREDVTRTSQAMRAAGVEHELVTAQGPHGYDFNKGPGAIGLLLWHDRALRAG